MLLKHQLAWGHDNFRAEPEPLSEELFPSVQSELLVTQLLLIPFHPIKRHQKEKTSFFLSIPLCEEVVDNNDVTPQSPL